MKRISAVIKSFKLAEVRDALSELGLETMTVCESKGWGRERGRVFDFVPRVCIEIVVPDESVEAAIYAIEKASFTGRTGDGMIFVTQVDEAIRIRTMERGELAL